MKKLNLYIDGFNLYFGLKSFGSKYKWLDVAEIGKKLCKSDQVLHEVKYFTAKIQGNDHAAIKRQEIYLEALQAIGVKVIFGKFLKKKTRCPKCKQTYFTFEEKESDVNLATELLVDAASNIADVYLLLSGDSDLILPMEKARDEYKRVVVPVFPPNRHSSEIKRRMGKFIPMSEALLRKSQLPSPVIKTDGYKLYRPKQW